MSSFFNWLGLFFSMLFTWLLFLEYLPCVAHCIEFASWEQCAKTSVDDILMMTALCGLSGFLWVSGNYREYHILYNWLIVTAQLIMPTCTYLIYVKIITGVCISKLHIICCGILVISFSLVILYLLESKKVIRNPWINKFFKALTVPDGKV
ncbi:hypothetical protein KR059_010961 [Drosophila kikkawai]|nr:hypothetical protein KR059_010961 [Drosophila kikkawai]